MKASNEEIVRLARKTDEFFSRPRYSIESNFLIKINEKSRDPVTSFRSYTKDALILRSMISSAVSELKIRNLDIGYFFKFIENWFSPKQIKKNIFYLFKKGKYNDTSIFGSFLRYLDRIGQIEDEDPEIQSVIELIYFKIPDQRKFGLNGLDLVIDELYKFKKDFPLKKLLWRLENFSFKDLWELLNRSFEDKFENALLREEKIRLGIVQGKIDSNFDCCFEKNGYLKRRYTYDRRIKDWEAAASLWNPKTVRKIQATGLKRYFKRKYQELTRLYQ